MKKSQKIAIDNTIRLSSKKEISNYFQAIVFRGQPGVYKKYGTIRITFTRNLMKDVEYLARLFWHWGLVPKELNKLKEGLHVGKGILLEEAYELILTKIPAIEFEDDDDFNEWWNNLKK